MQEEVRSPGLPPQFKPGHQQEGKTLKARGDRADRLSTLLADSPSQTRPGLVVKSRIPGNELSTPTAPQQVPRCRDLRRRRLAVEGANPTSGLPGPLAGGTEHLLACACREVAPPCLRNGSCHATARVLHTDAREVRPRRRPLSERRARLRCVGWRRGAAERSECGEDGNENGQ